MKMSNDPRSEKKSEVIEQAAVPAMKLSQPIWQTMEWRAAAMISTAGNVFNKARREPGGGTTTCPNLLLSDQKEHNCATRRQNLW
jgi:hypothetical protein